MSVKVFNVSQTFNIGQTSVTDAHS